MRPTAEKRTIGKISRRLLPLVVGMYFTAYIDRTNVGFAAIEMNRSLGFSNYVYGWGAGMFFLGYFLFEIPSNLILLRTGARRWISRIMISWGTISALMALVSGQTSFLALRFLLGVAEAGFFPGILLYFTFWFPAAYRARVVAILFLAVPGSNALAAGISSAALKLDGFLHLAGWQWIFIVESLPAILLGVAILFLLPDRPADARWLLAHEKAWLEAELTREQIRIEARTGRLTLFEKLFSRQVLVLAFLYLTIVTSTYGITFFLPLIVQSLGLSGGGTGVVAGIPYVVGTLGMVLWGYSSDRRGERKWHYVAACAVAGLGLIAAAYAAGETAAIVALSFAAAGLYGAMPAFWPLPSMFLTGEAAAAGLALINSLGNLGGFIGPYVVGWLSTGAGGFATGLWFLGGCALVSGLAGALALSGRGVPARAVASAAAAIFSPIGRYTPQWRWTGDHIENFIVHAPYRLRALVRASEIWLTVLAAATGILTGLTVLLISNGTLLMKVILFGPHAAGGLSMSTGVDAWRLFLIPPIGGLVFGLASARVARWRPRPATDPIEANALHGGRMSFLDSVIVTLQTIVSSGVGASVGLEAGYTQISSAVCSWFGRVFRVRRNDLRVLVGCGAAGAIAGAFGAPLTGAFYAFELILGTYNIASLAPVAIAAIVSFLVVRLVQPGVREIDLSGLGSIGPSDVAPIVTLSLICALAGILVMRSVTLSEQAFRRSHVPVWLRPCLGGCAVGSLALVTPQVLSSGHSALNLDLPAHLTFYQLASLSVFKALASAISIGAGFRGGLFFASIFLGALIGKFFFGVLALVTVVRTLPEPVYAVIGMSALAVAIVGGPLTMAFLALETTGSLPVTFAAFVAAVVSSLTVRRTFGYSFSTWRFHLRGEAIRSAVDVGWMRSLTASRMMVKEYGVVRLDCSLDALRKRFAAPAVQRVMVVDQADRYLGMIQRQDLHFAPAGTASIADLLHHGESVLLPDMTIKEAIAMFEKTETDALAVVDSAENMHVIGVLTEQFALRRYTEQLDRQRRVLSGE